MDWWLAAFKLLFGIFSAISAVIGLSIGIFIIDYPKVIFSDFDEGNDESTSNDRRKYSTPGIQKRDSSGVAARGCQLPLEGLFRSAPTLVSNSFLGRRVDRTDHRRPSLRSGSSSGDEPESPQARWVV